MDPIFTEEQLNRMSREDMCSLLKLMQQHQQKQEEALGCRIRKQRSGCWKSRKKSWNS